jgi:hypothetical protein
MGSPPPTDDGLTATSVELGLISAMSVGFDGTLYMVDHRQGVVWSVDTLGNAHVLAGWTYTQPPVTDNFGPAPQAYVPLPSAVAVGANGSIYEGDSLCRIRTLSPTTPAYVPGSGVIYYIPSEDGSQIFGFDQNGRHLATYDGRTGLALLTFTYNPSNQLYQVTDANGNITQFTGYGTGTVTIAPPFSPSSTTTIAIDSNGHASSITNPNAEVNQLVVAANGLMSQLTTPAGNVHKFGFDSLGNLSFDQDPLGTQYLNRTMSTTGQPGYSWSTGIESASGYTTGHAVTTATNGLVPQTTTLPSPSPQANASYARSLSDVRTVTAPMGQRRPRQWRRIHGSACSTPTQARLW